MGRKAEQTKRRKGSDKRRETFKKYGKNTSRGLRIKQQCVENKKAKNKNISIPNKASKDWGKKNCGNFHKVEGKLMKQVRHGHQQKPKKLK